MNISTTILNNITVNGRVNSVDARSLYKALEVKRDFSNWIKDQLSIFVENQDFVLLTLNGGQTGSGGHNRKDLHPEWD